MLLKKHFSKKGISPLIAVVLLVAFTLAIGLILSRWTHNITKQQTNVVTEKAGQNCEYLSFNLGPIYFYPLKRELIIRVTNAGDVDFSIAKIEIFNDTYAEKIYTPDEFANNVSVFTPGDSKYIILKNTIANVTEIRVIPNICQENFIVVWRHAITYKYD